MKRTIMAVLVLATVSACGDKDVFFPDPVIDPTISAVSPSQGTVGTEVRIEGTGFQPGAAVRFGTLTASAVDLEGGVLFAAAPGGLTGGTGYDIGVANPDGGSATSPAAFAAVAPTASRINGVTKPTSLQGMTIIVEGGAFGDDPALSEGRVWFGDGAGGAIEAVIADPANDWTNAFIVTSVPQGVSDTSMVWIETATGVSDSIEFRLIQSGTFSPSAINWTLTTPLPRALQGPGAAFVPVEEALDPANYVFTVGGADTLNVATDVVYRARVQPTGSLGDAWTTLASLPSPRAYHATAAATGFTAALDVTTTAAYLYVIGGQDAEGDVVPTVFVGHVDLAGEVTAWATTQPLPQPLRSAGAALFRGFIYVTGGAGPDDAPVATVYRAPVGADGMLGAWVQLEELPGPSAYHSFVNFGPFLYVLGGDASAVPAVKASMSGGEINDTYLGRINLRNGNLTADGWAATTVPPKERSKHSTVVAGGYLFVTSGVYPGQAGSSENVYGNLLSNGSVESWNGATGSNTIKNRLGYDLYNQAAVSFIDDDGNGRVMVLGGAKRGSEGEPSAAVVFY